MSLEEEWAGKRACAMEADSGVMQWPLTPGTVSSYQNQETNAEQILPQNLPNEPTLLTP